MFTVIKHGRRSGTVDAVASKSHVHRLLICAALADKKTVIRNVTFSADIMATVSCLNGYLADVFIDSDKITVQPYKKPQSNCVLNLNESGSTYRFLVPVACAMGVDVSFIGSDRLSQRPIAPLCSQLKKHGACLGDDGVFPYFVSGRICSGEYVVSGDVSSQFVSGLLFALPLLTGDSVIRVDGKLESCSYVKMTVNALKLFGITVDEENGTFYIKGGQRYVSPREVFAEGDWSNSAFFIALGALSEKGVTVNHLNASSLQGDRKMLEIVSGMGARVEKCDGRLTVSGGRLKGVKIDASDIPDLVPVLATLACAAEGETVIYNASRLRLKESDRIESVYAMLNALGADITRTDDGFNIIGKSSLLGGCVDSFNDHRIVMSASVAAAISASDVKITCSEAVNKSYPKFFEDINKLELE